MIIQVIFTTIFFLAIVIGEQLFPAILHEKSYTLGDWIMNLMGFVFQGLMVPLLSALMTLKLFPHCFPSLHGIIPLHFFGALLTNLIIIDALYYWQHRLFHQNPLLWSLHSIHHASPRVDVWATSRNTLFIQFIFVYLLVNPALAFMCQSPEGFLIGVTITANLDLLRHANIKIPKLLGIFVTPRDHHRHHDAEQHNVNFGANLLIWDKLFGTYQASSDYPNNYAYPVHLPYWRQLFFPFQSRNDL